MKNSNRFLKYFLHNHLKPWPSLNYVFFKNKCHCQNLNKIFNAIENVIVTLYIFFKNEEIEPVILRQL